MVRNVRMENHHLCIVIGGSIAGEVYFMKVHVSTSYVSDQRIFINVWRNGPGKVPWHTMSKGGLSLTGFAELKRVLFMCSDFKYYSTSLITAMYVLGALPTVSKMQ